MRYGELLDSLFLKESQHALIDQFVAEYLKANISDLGLKINRVYRYSTKYGVEAFGELKRLKKCAETFVGHNKDISYRAVVDLIKVRWNQR